jgi:outer membrane receptor for ferrienterochelin and colicins
LRAYRAQIDVENQRTAGVPVNPPQRIDDEVLEGQARWPLPGHGWVAGFEARNNALRDPGLPGGRSLAQFRAVFVQDEIALAERLTLTAGLRHDRHSLFGEVWSPRVYAVWRVDSQWTVKGGASHGFAAPNLKQIVPGARAEGPNTFIGNPSLQPETSDSVELGAGFTAGDVQAQVTLFAQRVKNLIDIRLLSAGTVPGTGTYTYENLAEARLRGLETSWTQALGGGFSAGLSYTYLDAQAGTGQRLDRRPRHSASARLDWRAGAWRAGVRAEHSGQQLLPATTVGAPSPTVPDVTLVGGHLAHAFTPQLEALLGVNNLGDMRLAEKSALFTQVEAPRTWRLSLRARW